jgi:hypothetical protein
MMPRFHADRSLEMPPLGVSHRIDPATKARSPGKGDGMGRGKSILWRVGSVLLPVVGWVGGASGADQAPSTAADVATSASSAGAAAVPDPWFVQLTPYGWMPSVSGSVEGPRGRSLSFDKSFGEVLQDLDFAAMGLAIVRYERLGMLLDLDYASFSVDGHFRGPLAQPYGVSMSTLIVTLAGTARVIDSPSFNADLVGGARVLSMSVDTHVTGPLGRSHSRSGSDTNVDGILGVRAAGMLGHGFSLVGYGDVGTGASQATWQALGALEYSFNETVSAAVGYRYLGYQFDGGSTTKRLGLSGPIIGLSFRF